MPTQTHPALLYSMLSIASVISVPVTSATPSLPPQDVLFQTALHHIHKLTTITPSHAFHLAGGGKRSHIFLCQAYVLMSLRQTRMGDKASAYLYASMASGMCLELGLHRRVGWGSGATGKKASQVSRLMAARLITFSYRSICRPMRSFVHGYGGAVTSWTRSWRKKLVDRSCFMPDVPRPPCPALRKRTSTNYGHRRRLPLSCLRGIGNATRTGRGRIDTVQRRCSNPLKDVC